MCVPGSCSLLCVSRTLSPFLDDGGTGHCAAECTQSSCNGFLRQHISHLRRCTLSACGQQQIVVLHHNCATKYLRILDLCGCRGDDSVHLRYQYGRASELSAQASKISQCNLVQPLLVPLSDQYESERYLPKIAFLELDKSRGVCFASVHHPCNCRRLLFCL